MKNKNCARAKVLTLIPIIVFAITVICFVLATILEVPTSRGAIYTILAFVALMNMFIAPLPCLLLSVLGTVFAAKAKKEGAPKSVLFLVLGIIEISLYVLGAIFAVLLFIGGMSV